MWIDFLLKLFLVMMVLIFTSVGIIILVVVINELIRERKLRNVHAGKDRERRN
jgi:hypothetical protein